MAIEHKWYMCGEDETYIYETDDNKRTIYRRFKNLHPATDDIKRELVFGVRDLGTIYDSDILDELKGKDNDIFNNKDNE